jgi:hypothetical protein
LAAKKKNMPKQKEPDLFSTSDERRRKPREWKYPKNINYSEVKVGDIFIFSKSRNWIKNAAFDEFRGEVLEKGVFDTTSRYFVVKIHHPEWEGIELEDIRRFILRKK